MEWISVDTQVPPDTGDNVMVKDANGNEAMAIACWYPFTEHRNPLFPRNFRMNICKPCEPYFGGWMIDVTHDWEKEIGEITHWKEIKK